MNYIEFINYKPIANDQFMVGIATIRLNLFDAKGNSVRIIQRYANKPTKDGGTFINMASYGYKDEGMAEKKWVSASALDSKSDDEMLIEFLRENVKRATQLRSVGGGGGGFVQSVSSQPIQSQAPNFANGGGATEAELPF